MPDYRWYQDVFISKVMLRKDCYKPYWKEKFIDGLPLIFAHKVKKELIGKNDSIWKLENVLKIQELFRPPKLKLRLNRFYTNLILSAE